jgi:hypothetical protein
MNEIEEGMRNGSCGFYTDDVVSLSRPTERLNQRMACLHQLQRGPGNKHTLPAFKDKLLHKDKGANKKFREIASQPSDSSHILYTCTLTTVKESLAYSLWVIFCYQIFSGTGE